MKVLGLVALALRAVTHIGFHSLSCMDTPAGARQPGVRAHVAYGERLEALSLK